MAPSRHRDRPQDAWLEPRAPERRGADRRHRRRRDRLRRRRGAVGSAQRADEVALDTERQLFTRALTNQPNACCAKSKTSPPRRRRIAEHPHQLRSRLGAALRRPAAAIVLRPRSRLRRRSVRPLPLRAARQPQRRSELVQFGAGPSSSRSLDLLRGRSDPAGAMALAARRDAKSARLRSRRPRCRSFLGRPAIVAAVAVVAPADDTAGLAALDANAPVVLSVKFIDDGVLADIASRLQLRNLRRVADGPVAAGDYRLRSHRQPGARRSRTSPGRRSGPAPRSSAASCRSSRSRSAASRCSRLSCCATCAAPRPRSRPAKRGCATSPCTIRSAACRTASISASGSKRSIDDGAQGPPSGRRVLHRPRSLQGRQRHARPSDRRRADPRRDAAPDAHAAQRRPGRAPRRRRVRRHHHERLRPRRRCRRSPTG